MYGEGLKGGKCHKYKMQNMFYFIFGYRPMDVVFCVNEYILNLGKYFFPFFFFLCIHKQALPHPSIILYLVLPKLFEDACAMCTTSLHTEPN